MKYLRSTKAYDSSASWDLLRTRARWVGVSAISESSISTIWGEPSSVSEAMADEDPPPEEDPELAKVLGW